MKIFCYNTFTAVCAFIVQIVHKLWKNVIQFQIKIDYEVKKYKKKKSWTFLNLFQFFFSWNYEYKSNILRSSILIHHCIFPLFTKEISIIFFLIFAETPHRIFIELIQLMPVQKVKKVKKWSQNDLKLLRFHLFCKTFKIWVDCKQNKNKFVFSFR